MANELTMDDVRRMQELEAELMRLRAIQEAMSPEERAALFEDSDMDEAMRYAEQDRDMRRRAEQGDAMANAILSDDVPSPQETDPNMRTLRRMEFPQGFLEKSDLSDFEPIDDVPRELKRAPMDLSGLGAGPRRTNMDTTGMGAGPRRDSIREDVMRNLMAAEEPEEEL